MKRLLPSVFPALVLLVLARPVDGGPSWRPWNAGLSEARNSNRPVLVDVYTDWCGWCRRMDRDVYSRQDVQDYLARQFVTVKLNAESGDPARYEGRAYTSRTLAARLGVSGYPTTVFLNPDGSLIGSVPGYAEPGRFLLLLRYVREGHARRGVSFEDFARGRGVAAPSAPREAGR